MVRNRESLKAGRINRRGWLYYGHFIIECIQRKLNASMFAPGQAIATHQ